MFPDLSVPCRDPAELRQSSGRSRSPPAGVLTASAIKPTFGSAAGAGPSGSYARERRPLIAIERSRCPNDCFPVVRTGGTDPSSDIRLPELGAAKWSFGQARKSSGRSDPRGATPGRPPRSTDRARPVYSLSLPLAAPSGRHAATESLNCIERWGAFTSLVSECHRRTIEIAVAKSIRPAAYLFGRKQPYLQSCRKPSSSVERGRRDDL